MKSSIWICYDLGVRGDYEGIYAWLDKHEAIECGDALAYMKYEYTGSLVDSLTKELQENVDFTKQSRVYLIYRDKESKKMKGSFIIGGRKAPAWAGYAGRVTQPDVEET